MATNGVDNKTCINCFHCKVRNRDNEGYRLTCKARHWETASGQPKSVKLYDSDFQRQHGRIAGIYPSNRRTFNEAILCQDYDHFPIGGANS